MSRKPRIGALATAALLAAALTASACGREGAPALDTTAGTVSDGPATGTVTVWAMGGEGESLPTLAKAFEKRNPEVDIQVTAIPWQSAHDKLANSIAAEVTPDMAMIGTTWIAEFAAAGGLRPVPEDLVDPDRFFAGNQQTTEYRGQSWGVPWYADARILIYRKDLARNAGVDAPTTWRDYHAFNQALADAGVQWPTMLAPGGDGATNMFLPFVWQTGGRIMNVEGTEFTLDTPEVRRALREYRSYFEDGQSPLQGIENYQNAFIEGELGSFVSGPYELGTLTQMMDDAGIDPKRALGVVPMPYDEKPGAFTGGANLSVFRTADNPDAAWKFIRFLSRPDIQKRWYELTTDMPAVKSAWQSGKLADDPKAQQIERSIQAGSATPPIVTWVQIDDMLNRELEKVMRGVNTVPEGAAAMQRKAELIGTGS